MSRCTDLVGPRRAYRDVQIMLVRTGVLPSAHCRRSPPRPSRRCAAATLAYLVTTTLMDQAYAPYAQLLHEGQMQLSRLRKSSLQQFELELPG